VRVAECKGDSSRPNRSDRVRSRAGRLKRWDHLRRIFHSVRSVRKSERPTLPPGFDVSRFARDSDQRLRSTRPGAIDGDLDSTATCHASTIRSESATGHASAIRPESAIRSASAEGATRPASSVGATRSASPEPASSESATRSERRLVTRPRLGAFVTNEAWARSMAGRPYVALTGEALKRLPLDHRAGFVLSLMDGAIELETVIELCAMQRDDALTIIRDLYESDVVRFS
jgi:hypothetical protein